MGILKRMALALSGLMLAGVAALTIGAAPAAAASPVSSGHHFSSSCGCWDDCDWDDCDDDCGDDCDDDCDDDWC